jgi:hypothetical protein
MTNKSVVIADVEAFVSSKTASIRVLGSMRDAGSIPATSIRNKNDSTWLSIADEIVY